MQIVRHFHPSPPVLYLFHYLKVFTASWLLCATYFLVIGLINFTGSSYVCHRMIYYIEIWDFVTSYVCSHEKIDLFIFYLSTVVDFVHHSILDHVYPLITLNTFIDSRLTHMFLDHFNHCWFVGYWDLFFKHIYQQCIL